ncbi:MAG: hypothetical protein JWN72_2651 [Thermoleophilia bacterium]|nr:hypothetical protein [Thermoleophilia bacterium]
MMLSGPSAVPTAAVPVRTHATKVDHFTPAEQAKYDVSVAAEGRLTTDALQRIGVPASALDGLKALPDSLGDDAVHSSGYAANRPISVPLGLQVATGTAADQQWTVVGVGADRQVELARRTEQGTIARSAAPWATLVERNASLFDNLKGGTLNHMRAGVADASEGITALGRSAPLDLTAARTNAYDTSHPGAPFRLASTWGELIDETKLADRTPKVAAPGMFGAVNLRSLLGDRQHILSSIGYDENQRTLLVGTESAPGPGKPALDDIHATQRWFKDVAKVDVFPPDRKLYADTDQSGWLANASAGEWNERGTESTIVLNQGPRDASVRGAMLSQMSGKEGRGTKKYSDLIYGNGGYTGVGTHEAGHVVNANNWRPGSSTKDPAVAMETGIVDEAMADLFGVSRAQKGNLAHLRGMTTLQKGFDNLETLRKDIKKTGGEPHTGTQLITKPMMGLAKAVGWPMVAEITGAASTQLGIQVANSLPAVTIPAAASALLTAAAWRLGADSPAVEQLKHGWEMLKVPAELPTNPARS